MNFYIVYLLAGKVVDVCVYDDEFVRDQIFNMESPSSFYKFDDIQKFNQI